MPISLANQAKRDARCRPKTKGIQKRKRPSGGEKVKVKKNSVKIKDN